MAEKKDYTANDIKVLEGLEGIRKRPAMYIGSTGKEGLHHLVYEVVDNSVDEAIAGYCTNIWVTLNEDGSLTVKDNGRGIPTGMHPIKKKTGVEMVFTELHTGGKFNNQNYKTSGGLHGVGSSVVNALSTWLVAEVSRDGNIYRQKYEKGVAVTELEIVGKSEHTGTTITFLTVFPAIISFILSSSSAAFSISSLVMFAATLHFDRIFPLI